MRERFEEISPTTRLILLETERIEEAKDSVVRADMRGSREGITVDEATFMLGIRQLTLLKLWKKLKSEDPLLLDLRVGELRRMNDALPMETWRRTE